MREDDSGMSDEKKVTIEVYPPNTSVFAIDFKEGKAAIVHGEVINVTYERGDDGSGPGMYVFYNIYSHAKHESLCSCRVFSKESADKISGMLFEGHQPCPAKDFWSRDYLQCDVQPQIPSEIPVFFVRMTHDDAH